ncbi:flavoprotein oxidoreductase [Vallicoccus soli]|uniref:Flavoprotein oxidoreductase n=2 Tax=Vallicoccus soli TaxID=2339232 RepID=A0A3A3YSN1_9ACTN|nr:flavoprotein oxidoreductase [Vallicoccus soli]
MSAAAQAKRLRGDDLEVVVLDRGRHTSYSACGIPYWVGGEVDGPDALVARSPEEHRRRGLDLRLRTEAVGLDLAAGVVHARDLDAGTDLRFGYDHLLHATGAVPVRPPVPGIDAAGVFGVQVLDDGQAVIDHLAGLPDGARGVVVGAGYIGVEMAEALVRHGLRVTVVDKAPEPMTTLDPDMGAMVHREMECLGIDVRTGTGLLGVETGADGAVRAVVTEDGTLPADVVVLGLGVRPATGLAREAGLPLGDAGGVRTDLRMAVPGHEGVWAAGDCVEVFDRVSQSWLHVPLGTHANKQGRVAGTNLGGGYATFPGVVRTAISKVCGLEIGRTGLTERDARAAGFRYVVGRIESTTTAGYMPAARSLHVKVLAEVGSGRLLGAQVVGFEGSAKRIDVFATALWNRMTVDEMTGMDLSYAPPFSPVWDAVLIAARKTADLLQPPGGG